jgi:hydrogenase maturation protein HypF
METFPMCPECGREYADPDDRRYHAQPNACPVCGPNVWMGELSGTEAIRQAAALVDRGEIIAMRGLGGYHLICDAYNKDTVKRLREHKLRPTKPFAIMTTDLSSFELAESVREELFSGHAPVISLPCADKELLANINPEGNEAGVMLPYTPLHRLLLNFTKTNIIIATSGNRHDEPIAASPEEAEAALAGFTPHFLHHNRPIHNRIDDSVAMYAAGELRLLRRGRGYAPFPAILPMRGRMPVFAAGAGLKNTITLTKGQYAFTSAYIGDLDSEATVRFYGETYEHMLSLLNLKPELAVCDLHPGYYSTNFAESLGVEVLQLQHHKAHLYAAMAEHKLTENVIGVVMDGTGYGEDGAIWGCEFFSLSGGKITRHYHLEYVPQAAGDASVKNPSRMAQSWLMAADMWRGYEEFWTGRMGLSPDLATLNGRMISGNINTLPTSSAGRLCEAAGAMVLGIGQNEYEAHAAVVLENRADESVGLYPYEISRDELIFRPAIRQMAEDILKGEKNAKVSAYFHNTLAAAAAEICGRIAKETGINTVVLSGGVFQNKRLLESLHGLLGRQGINCLTHKYVPSNDGGISLGQAYYGVILP